MNPAAFRTAPPSAAPVTHRFVKEVLRQWSPPLLLVRRSTVPFDLGKTRLAPGDRYLLSPRMMHRDGRVRNGPDLFDPDRILPGASHGPADRTCYVPFGWAPKKCVGANVAIVQLMALCHLLCNQVPPGRAPTGRGHDGLALRPRTGEAPRVTGPQWSAPYILRRLT